MRIGIIGASGYTGSELVRILLTHPHCEIACITSENSSGSGMDDIYPHFAKFFGRQLTKMDDASLFTECDALFTALPHGHAMEIARKAVASGVLLIDLGPDFRFSNKDTYEEWYKIRHTYEECPSVYGLTELYRQDVKDAKVIGNPGCYATAAILSVAPLVKYGLIENTSIVIDGKSGVSGAGRGLSLNTHFSESTENVKAYNIAHHRHTPEIEQILSDIAGSSVVVSFTPHLIPMTRGIFCTSYADLKEGADSQKVGEAFRETYGNEFFIRLLGEGGYPSTKYTRGSNFCDIAWHVDKRTGRVIVASAIDNLVKGAAGQAVQNMNAAFGFDESAGLFTLPLYP